MTNKHGVLIIGKQFKRKKALLSQAVEGYSKNLRTWNHQATDPKFHPIKTKKDN
jgi:hypothetical protein